MIGPILVILPHNPGDVVMALQTIQRLKAAWPSLEVDYVCSEECRELVDGHPLLRRVILLPRQSLKTWLSRNQGDEILQWTEKFLMELAGSRYSLSLNLFQEKMGGMIQAFIHADRKVGLEFAEHSFFRIESRLMEHLSAIPASRKDNGWHAVDIYIRAARRALETLEPSETLQRAFARNPRDIPVTSSRDTSTQNFFSSNTALPPLSKPAAAALLDINRYLVFHPGSAWPGKRWPEKHWARLAEACARANLQVALTGAPEEQPVADRILNSMSPDTRGAVVNCVGKTNLLEAAWILANAQRVVTGDTVAMHLAAAVGTPVFALFGASNPIETGPYGNGHVLLQTDPDLPADLILDREHDRLARVEADWVAEYLLHGVWPEAATAWARLWETAWDVENDCQVLRDFEGKLHPHQQRAQPWMRLLDGRARSRFALPTTASSSKATEPAEAMKQPGPSIAKRSLQAEIENCLNHLDGPGLAKLQAAELLLAAETRDSLIWEAYRIALNGLSVRDAREHVRRRKELLERALREELSVSLSQSQSASG